MVKNHVAWNGFWVLTMFLGKSISWNPCFVEIFLFFFQSFLSNLNLPIFVWTCFDMALQKQATLPQLRCGATSGLHRTCLSECQPSVFIREVQPRVMAWFGHFCHQTCTTTPWKPCRSTWWRRDLQTAQSSMVPWPPRIEFHGEVSLRQLAVQ